MRKKSASKRTLIKPHKGDRRYVRRNKKGQFKTEVNVGPSLAAPRTLPVIDNGGRYCDVRDYGAVMDGTTDDAPALNAAIADARTKGRAVYIPAGTLAIGSQILIDGGTYASPINPVNIEGAGGAINLALQNVGHSDGTVIKWIGPGNMQNGMIRFIGCSAYGHGLKNLTLDGNNTAAFGLYIDGSLFGRYDNLTVRNLSANAAPPEASWGVKLGVSRTAATCNGNVFTNLTIDLQSGSGGCLYLTGLAGGGLDAVFNVFVSTHISYGGARHGIILGYCDNNTFIGTVMYNSTNPGTGHGVFAWYGDPANPTPGIFPAQNAFYYLMTDGGGWYTDNLSSDKNRKNVVFALNQGDSPVPTINSGGLQWTDARGGLQHGGGQRTRLNFASTRAGGESAFVAVLVPGARIGDAVVVTPPPACIERGGFYTGHVHDNSGNVWLKFHNDTAASIDPPSGEFVIATL